MNVCELTTIKRKKILNRSILWHQWTVIATPCLGVLIAPNFHLMSFTSGFSTNSNDSNWRLKIAKNTFISVIANICPAQKR